MTLFCYILDTPVNNAVPVDFDKTMKVDNIDISLEKLNIAHLKKLIWPNNIRANELKLWKFITPLEEDNNKLKELNDEFRNNIDLTQKLGKSLNPATKFIDAFSDWNNVPDGHFH